MSIPKWLGVYLLILSFAGCCPTLVGNPGDESAKGWNPRPDGFWTGRDLPERQIIDCKGETRKSIAIRRSNVTVRNCKVTGDIRIWGQARNGQAKVLYDLSREKDYVTKLRASSPTGVTIEDSSVMGTGRIPIYVGPGVTFTNIRNVHVMGKSSSVMIYLGAESHGTTIIDSTIDAKHAGREVIAIDASNGNTIRRTAIKNSGAGVYLYRNCGEGGTIRHTTPSNNTISNNTFSGVAIAVWLGSREGNRCYCGEDSGHPFGSSSSDMDHARFNTVTGNSLNGAVIRLGAHAEFNVIKDNKGP